jgi:hypothetical protein
MGRPRKYANDAERQRAWRQRLEAEMVRVNRADLERLEATLTRLQKVVEEAAQAGDETAQGCRSESVGGMLEKLVRHFERCAQEHQEPLVAEGQHRH